MSAEAERGGLKRRAGFADSKVMEPDRQMQLQREGVLAQLASAFQRKELDAFSEVCRPDMTLTLAGSSRLAATYHGYGAFAAYLKDLRDVLRSAERQIRFEHDDDQMIFWQVMEVSGRHRMAEMTLRVTVHFHPDGRILSFFVEPEDQALFDSLVDSVEAVDLSDTG